jgi:hypothetical protein
VLHVGLDLSRRRVDVCLISAAGELLGQFRAPVDRDGLHGLVRRVGVHGGPVRAVIESMNGARFVHDELTGLLARPDPQPTLRSGRRHASSGRLTAQAGNAPRSEPQ